MAVTADRDGWVLAEAVEGDIDRLMKWFSDKDAVNVWGGPEFRYPFTRHSFAEDMHWGRMASFSLRDPRGQFAAFGQVYERFERINLARLVANPAMRGQGIGKRLVKMLMAGANVTMMASALIKHGINHIRAVETDLRMWMEKHEYHSVSLMRGSMSQIKSANPTEFERAQYVQAVSTLPKGYKLF